MLYENNQNELNDVFVFISDIEYEFWQNEAIYINNRLSNIDLVLLDIELESNFSLIQDQSLLLNEFKKEQLLIEIQQQMKKKEKLNRNSNQKSKSKSKSKTSIHDKTRNSINRKSLNLPLLLKQKGNKKHASESFNNWSTRFMDVLSSQLDSLINKKQNILNYNRSQSNKKKSSLLTRKKELLNQMKHLKIEQIEEIAKNILNIPKTQDAKYEIDLSNQPKAVIDELEKSVVKYKNDNVNQLFNTLNKEDSHMHDNNGNNSVNTMNKSSPLVIYDNPLARPNLSNSSFISSSLSSSSSSSDSESLGKGDPISFSPSGVYNFSFQKRKNSKEMEKENSEQDKGKDFFDNYTTNISDISHDL